MEGHGEWRCPQGRCFSGQWRAGKMNGKGVLTVPESGAHYEGSWKEGLFHDHGDLRFSDGTRYVGSWRAGREHGTGVLTAPDGKVYDGCWARGQAHGRGKLTYPGGSKSFEGQFQASRPHGHGQMSYADGTQYVGQWQYGEPAGQGRWRDAGGVWLSRSEAPEGHTDVPTPVSSARGPSRWRVQQGLPAPPSEQSEPSEGGGSSARSILATGSTVDRATPWEVAPHPEVSRQASADSEPPVGRPRQQSSMSPVAVGKSTSHSHRST